MLCVSDLRKTLTQNVKSLCGFQNQLEKFIEVRTMGWLVHYSPLLGTVGFLSNSPGQPHLLCFDLHCGAVSESMEEIPVLSD